MGVRQPKPEYKDHYREEVEPLYKNYQKGNFFDHFEFHKLTEDKYFGKIFIFKERYGSHEVFVQQVVNESKGVMKTPKNVADVFELRPPTDNILRVWQYDIYQSENIHQYFPKHTFVKGEHVELVIFETFRWDLEREFDKMERRGSPYSESSLWKISDNVICALAKMQKNLLQHGHKLEARHILNCDNVYKMSYIQPVIDFCTKGKDPSMSRYKQEMVLLAYILEEAANINRTTSNKLSNGWLEFIENLKYQGLTALDFYLDSKLNKLQQERKQEKKKKMDQVKIIKEKKKFAKTLDNDFYKPKKRKVYEYEEPKGIPMLYPNPVYMRNYNNSGFPSSYYRVPEGPEQRQNWKMNWTPKYRQSNMYFLRESERMRDPRSGYFYDDPYLYRSGYYNGY